MQCDTMNINIEFYRTYTLLALSQELKSEQTGVEKDWQQQLDRCTEEVKNTFNQIIDLTIHDLEQTRTSQKNYLLLKIESTEKCSIQDSPLLRQIALRVLTDPEIANKLTSPENSKKQLKITIN